MSAYAVVGPERHGVVAHALALARADPGLADSLVRIAAGDHATVARDLVKALDGHGTAMLHVTDHLFGPTPAAAADLLESVSRTTALVLCLHDLPQAAEGEDRHARRSAAYARFTRCATVVVVASEHERQLLLRCLERADADGADGTGQTPQEGHSDRDVPVVVLPLAVERISAPGQDPALEAGHDQPVDTSGEVTDASSETPPSLDPAPGRRRSPDRIPLVAVLGFLYPGKGLEDVIEAAAKVAAEHEVAVVNIGAVAAGHDDLAEQLAALAAERGIDFHVSGFVPEGELVDVLRQVDVPVASHRHISASASVNSWIAAGRRPLVVAGSYTRELDARMPGAITLVESRDDLATSVADALREPASTWIADDVVIGPTWAQSAAAHEAVLRGVS